MILGVRVAARRVHAARLGPSFCGQAGPALSASRFTQTSADTLKAGMPSADTQSAGADSEEDTRIPFRTYVRDIGVAITISAFGDVVCQYLENRHAAGADGKEVAIDPRRTAAFAVTNGCYTGGICNFIFSKYPALCKQFVVAVGTTFTPRLFGTWCTIVDNFLHVPILYTPAIFIVNDFLLGKTQEDAMRNLR